MTHRAGFPTESSFLRLLQSRCKGVSKLIHQVKHAAMPHLDSSEPSVWMLCREACASYEQRFCSLYMIQSDSTQQGRDAATCPMAVACEHKTSARSMKKIKKSVLYSNTSDAKHANALGRCSATILCSQTHWRVSVPPSLINEPAPCYQPP